MDLHQLVSNSFLTVLKTLHKYIRLGLSKLKKTLQLGKTTKLINLHVYLSKKQLYDTT